MNEVSCASQISGSFSRPVGVARDVELSGDAYVRNWRAASNADGNTEPFLAMVEIVADGNGRPPSVLLRTLYRLSEFGKIVLALQQLTPRAINPVLDEVVRELPLTIPGVAYVDAGDERAIAAAAHNAMLLAASTTGFRLRLRALGIVLPLLTCAAVLREIPKRRIAAHPQKLGEKRDGERSHQEEIA